MNSMIRIQRYGADAGLFLLILLWVYAAAGKLMQFETFRLQMARQHLGEFITPLLPYGLPFAELGCAGLLVFPLTRSAGLVLSVFLMSVFTGYIGLVLLHAFGNIPCACGGVISALGWRSHFVFNIFFLLLSTYTLYVHRRERRGQ